MTYTLYAGCSYTAGTGFLLEKNEPCLWVNQLHDRLFAHTTKLNIGKGGRSNAGIFQDTVKSLLSYPVEFAIVEWTSYPRYEIDLGFESYTTTQHFIPNSPCQDHNLNDISYSAQYLNSIRDRVTTLSHPCSDITQLIEYANIIKRLAKKVGTRVFFVNGLATWDKDFFVRQTDVLPSNYSEYTKKILNVDNRDDSETFLLYNRMHDNFDQAGGICLSDWLNLYSSLKQCKIDVNLDNTHPGIHSNNRYTDMLANALIPFIKQ